jgi:ribonuclease P/MRP protein subunit RPP1
MYEGVHAHPDGERAATVARHALSAADLGYDGVVVRNHGDAPAEYDAGAAAEEYDVDVADGVEVRTDDRTQAASLVKRFREEYTVVCVHGRSPDINRFAVEEPRVDVLAHPMRGDGDVNHVLARAARENGVRLEFDFGPVLRGNGGRRVRAIQRLRKLHDMVTQYDVPYVVTAGVESHLDWRPPRDLASVPATFGFDPEWVREGVAEWGHLVARNRDRSGDSFIQPGVRRGRYEEDHRGTRS